jgi:hypothetical protein
MYEGGKPSVSNFHHGVGEILHRVDILASTDSYISMQTTTRCVPNESQKPKPLSPYTPVSTNFRVCVDKRKENQ